ncbi:MAG: inorganic phosphate transporter [Nitrososphaerales archaeon]
MFTTLVIGIIVVAFSFDFVNGFHDAANSISTVVSTRALSPPAAVGLAATFNFVAFLIFGFAVASTIGSGIISPSAINSYVILGALLGAISWDLITWFFGLPTSSSHALIGGLIGAGVTEAGPRVLVIASLSKTLLFLVTSPLIGLALAFVLMTLLLRAFRHYSARLVNAYFKRLQILSSSLVSLAHGSNDAQKTMGVVTALLVSTGNLSKFSVPLWVAIMANSAIALGTLFGGWRIVNTMGFKITKLDPVHGFAAETTAAGVIMTSSLLGIPVSTTHCVSGSIMGVGATRRLTAVRWGVARRIVWAWLITIPACAAISCVAYLAIIHIV